MTTEAGTVEGAEKAAPEAAVLSQDDGHDWEAEARDLGWIPEAEFKGSKKPERFKTAQEFVEDIPPYVKKLLERQEKKLSERVANIEKVNSKTIERLTTIHKQEVADLKAQKKQAIADGDVDLVEKLDDKLDKIRDEAPLTDDPKAKKAAAEKAFGDANPWYGSNRKMTAFARGLSNDLANAATEAGKSMSYEENITEVLKAVREEFPEYFEKKPTTTANGHAAVDGGSDTPAASGKDPLAKLPAEARAQARDDMKKFPKIYPNAQAWVDAYNS